MHPFSILALAIFVAGYITARWDLVTRLYELAIFAWDHGVVVRSCTVVYELPTAAYFNSIDSHCKRICNSLDFLLPVHHTRREAGIEGDGLGKGVSGAAH